MYKNRPEELSYERTKMQKDMIISLLREDGCRITKQRQMLLDIILEEDCSCCKEIYYKAVKRDPNIGTATVYRMITTLEKIGAINKKNMYRISCGGTCNTCMIELEDHSVFQLTEEKLKTVIAAGLKACGYTGEQNMRSIVLN